MKFEQLFYHIKERFGRVAAAECADHMAFEFRFRDEENAVFYVEMKEGRINVEPYNYYDRDAIIVATGETYYEIITGALNPKIAFALGRLQVEGDVAKAAELAGLLATK